MFIIKNKNLFLGFTVLLVIVSCVVVGVYGLKESIEFAGGSVMEVAYKAPVTAASSTPAVASTRPPLDVIKQDINKLSFGSVIVQPIDQEGLLVKTRSLTEQERLGLLSALSKGGTVNVEQQQFNSIGPVIGAELRTKSIYAIILVILLIMLYISFAFRKVSHPVASWKYGIVAIITLVHDVIVPTGFYALYSHFTGAELDVLFVTAILAVLGFSIHDTIVVFDRIRENLKYRGAKESFGEVVGKSLSQTFTRSINTSLTVVLTLLVLYFVGGETTRNFSLLLIVGITAGTYSSIFFASPLLVEMERWQAKK